MRFAILLLTALFLSASVFACQFDKQGQPIEAFYNDADDVLTAHVPETKEKVVRENETEFRLVEAKYDVVEVFKGTPTGKPVMDAVLSPGSCSLPLMAGLDCVFLLKNGEPYPYVGASTGSLFLGHLESEDAKQKIAKLRSLRR